jgi:hypothetical protein
LNYERRNHEHFDFDAETLKEFDLCLKKHFWRHQPSLVVSALHDDGALPHRHGHRLVGLLLEAGLPVDLGFEVEPGDDFMNQFRPYLKDKA